MKRLFLVLACLLFPLFSYAANPGEAEGYIYRYSPNWWVGGNRWQSAAVCQGKTPDAALAPAGCRETDRPESDLYITLHDVFNEGWSQTDHVCYQGHTCERVMTANSLQGTCAAGWERGNNNAKPSQRQFCRIGKPVCTAPLSAQADGKCGCPEGSTLNNNQCVKIGVLAKQDKTPASQVDSCDCRIQLTIGDPIGLDRGRTVIDEIDYSATGSSALAFVRHYDSQRVVPAVTSQRGWDAAGWTHNYDIRLFSRTTDAGQSQMVLRLGAQVVAFQAVPGSSTQWAADADQAVSLTKEDNIRWVYRDGDEAVWTFDIYRNPVSLVQRNGYTLTFDINANQDITRVRDSFQRELRIDYDGLLIKQVTPPSGKVITYGYDAGKLASVSHADGTRRQYQYLARVSPIAGAPAMLSDLIDEKQQPFAHWEYDATTGLTTATWEAGKLNHYQVDQYQFDAQNQLQSVRFTDPLGVSHSYGQASQLDVTRPRQETRSGARAGDPVQTRSQIYDTQNNLASYTDFGGTTTTFKYDLARNLQIERVDAAGTDKATTTRTQWSPSLRIPLAISAPSLRTTFVPDTKGNILSRTEQATLDPNGSQGFNATLTGSARVWQYTYHPNGLLWTITEPDRSVSTFVYDTQGNLSQATDGAGLVTLYQDYTPAGQVGRIKQTDGVVVTLGYDLRNRLKTRTVGTLVSTYSYHPTGQLSQVDTPDGRKLNYDYDTARRLSVIRDNVGNRIVYTLDAMGNRKLTELQDSSNSLAQLVAQIDADRAPLARPTARTAS
ncbi:RHS repeat domain-containing protein [Chitinimonas arctica]|nr:DUF6531 domain-containing protein [Chitinimonas arctica]